MHGSSAVSGWLRRIDAAIRLRSPIFANAPQMLRDSSSHASSGRRTPTLSANSPSSLLSPAVPVLDARDLKVPSIFSEHADAIVAATCSRGERPARSMSDAISQQPLVAPSASPPLFSLWYRENAEAIALRGLRGIFRRFARENRETERSRSGKKGVFARSISEPRCQRCRRVLEGTDKRRDAANTVDGG